MAGDSLLAEGIDEAAGQLRRRAGRDQIEQLGGGGVVFLQIDELRRGGQAVVVGQSRLCWRFRRGLRPSWRFARRALVLPQRVASAATCDLAAGGSFSKSAASDFSSSGVRFALRSRGQPRARPRRMAVATSGWACSKAATSGRGSADSPRATCSATMAIRSAAAWIGERLFAGRGDAPSGTVAPGWRLRR